MTRVAVVAANPVTRAGLQAILAATPTMEIVGTAPTVAALEQHIDPHGVDVLLFDHEHGTGDLAEGVTELGHEGVALPVVVLQQDPADHGIVEALQAGVRAVLPQEASGEEIVAAVMAAASGLVALRPETVTLLPVAGRAAHTGAPPRGEALTGREIEVLGLLAEGLGNKEIARQLGISEHTVKFHVGSILAKLNAASRTEAVTAGLRQGLIMV